MDGLELLTSVFLDDLARNPTATREENPAGAAPDSDAPPGPGTRPMSPPSTQPAWTASAPPFLGAPAFRARQSLSRQGQDRRCLLAPLSTPAYSSASTPAVRWRATSFPQPYMWASLRKHLPSPHPQPGAAGVSLSSDPRFSRAAMLPFGYCGSAALDDRKSVRRAYCAASIWVPLNCR